MTLTGSSTTSKVKTVKGKEPAGPVKRRSLSSLAIVVIVILTTYSLFFVFQVNTELRIRGSTLQQAKNEYESLANELSYKLSSGISTSSISRDDISDIIGKVKPRADSITESADGTMLQYDSEPTSIENPQSIALLDNDGNPVWLRDSKTEDDPLILAFGESGENNNDNTSNNISNHDWRAIISQTDESGTAVSSVYKTEDEEYLVVVSNSILMPIVLAGIPADANINDEDVVHDIQNDSINLHAYYLVISVPLSVVFHDIDDILLVERLQTFSLVAAISIITIVMAFFINRSNRLGREATERALELEKSNSVVVMQQQDLEKANQDLKRLDKLKDQFISIASHELKNPIQPILFYAEFAKRGKITPDKAIDEILVNAKRLRKLAADLLDVAKIDSGNLSYSFNTFKLSDLISEVIGFANPSTSAGVSLEVSANEDYSSLEMDGDRTRLFQVLVNIINNSLKFTEKGFVRLTVNTDHGKNLIIIAIADTGNGIPAEILPNLFGKFVSGSGDAKNRHGTGLGLYIAKAIITDHGGLIEAQNNLDGPGATFRISLPIKQNDHPREQTVSVARQEMKADC